MGTSSCCDLKRAPLELAVTSMGFLSLCVNAPLTWVNRAPRGSLKFVFQLPVQ